MTCRPGSPAAGKSQRVERLERRGRGGERLHLGADRRRAARSPAPPVPRESRRRAAPTSSRIFQRTPGGATGSRAPFGTRCAVSAGSSDRTITGGIATGYCCSAPPAADDRRSRNAACAARRPTRRGGRRPCGRSSRRLRRPPSRADRRPRSRPPYPGTGGKRIVANFGARTRTRTVKGSPTVTVSRADARRSRAPPAAARPARRSARREAGARHDRGRHHERPPTVAAGRLTAASSSGRASPGC